MRACPGHRRSHDRDRPRPGRCRRTSTRSPAPPEQRVAAVLVTHDHPDHAPGAATFAAAGRGAAVRVPARRRRAPARRTGGERGRPARSSPCTPRATRATTSRSTCRRRGRCSRATPCSAAARASSIRPTATSRSTCARSRRMQELARADDLPGPRPGGARCAGEAAGVHRSPGRAGAAGRRARCRTGPARSRRWSSEIYAAYPPEVRELAARSVLAHLLKLSAEGRVAQRGRGDDGHVGGDGPSLVRAVRQARGGPGALLRHVQLDLLQEGSAESR